MTDYVKQITFAISASGTAWWDSATANQWLALTGGAADTLSVIDPCPTNNCSYSGIEKQISMVADWCGGAASSNSMVIATQGGHGNYGGNECYEYVFNVATPRWFRRIDPSTNVPTDVGYYPDGKPSSRHGYKHDCWIGPGTNGNRWFAPLAFAVWGNGNTHVPLASSWQQGSASYDPQGTFPDFPGLLDYDDCVAYDSAQHKVWVQEGGLTGNWRVYALDVATKTWTTYATSTQMQSSQLCSGFIDPVRRLFVIQSGSSLFIRDLAFPNNAGRAYTVSGMSGVAIAYEPVSGKWVNWDGGKSLRVITPPSNYRTGDGSTANPLNASATYASTVLTPAAGATPGSAQPLGTYGRFAYVANPAGFCLVNSTTTPTYFYKLPASGLATSSFTTTFPVTENPISESGAWVHNATSWQRIQTTGGNAIAAAYTENYDDAYAYLANWAGNDYEIIATIYFPSGNPGETELLVRLTDTASTVTCYECLYNAVGSWQIVRWNGAMTDFTVVAGGSCPTGSNGNQIRATVVGTALNFYWRANSGASWTSIGSYGSVNLATGKPGVGLYVHASSGNRTTVGFQDFTVNSL